MKTTEETKQLNVEVPVSVYRNVKSEASLDGAKLHEWVVEALVFYRKNRKRSFASPDFQPSGVNQLMVA